MAKYTITIHIDEDGIKVVPASALSNPMGAPANPHRASITAAPIGGGGPGDIGPGTGGPGDIGPGSGGPGDIGPGTGGPGDIGPGTGSVGLNAPRTAVKSYLATTTNEKQRNIAIPLQPQEQVEWCWAAIAVAIDKYFNPASTLRQCDVANRVLGKDCCRKGAATLECNEAEKLQDALTVVGHFRGAIGQALSFEQVQAEIDAGRPACARIAWDSGGAHFVAIDGYRVLPSGAQHIRVADPLNPPSEVDFDEFTSAYHGEGTWTGTYLVRA